MKQLLTLTALLVMWSGYAADPAPKVGTPVANVGIVSVDQKFVFLPAKEGGIEAIELATGKVVWTNKAGAKLAGASDKLVFAWTGEAKKANEFRLFAMDVTTGKTVGKSDPIAMPGWATTAKVHGRTFRTAAKTDGEGAVVVWEAGAFYAGGAAPTPEIIAAAKKNANGVAKIDFKSGKVTNENRKPKEDEFSSSPSGALHLMAAGYEFRVSEQLPGLKPGALSKVTLTVLKDTKPVWTRELAGNPFSPPPP
ncbi:MAG: hypothetical protein L0241_09640 [Planctomycetia bacterium]|nr:hypothetical protein [Planctomycetia bacterium]